MLEIQQLHVIFSQICHSTYLPRNTLGLTADQSENTEFHEILLFGNTHYVAHIGLLKFYNLWKRFLVACRHYMQGLMMSKDHCLWFNNSNTKISDQYRDWTLCLTVIRLIHISLSKHSVVLRANRINWTPGGHTRSQHIVRLPVIKRLATQRSSSNSPGLWFYVPGAVLPFATPIFISLIPTFANLSYCEVHVKCIRSTQIFFKFAL
jgi:hypothetical protein